MSKRDMFRRVKVNVWRVGGWWSWDVRDGGERVAYGTTHPKDEAERQARHYRREYIKDLERMAQ